MQGKKLKGITEKDSNHHHRYALDENGNGYTTSVDKGDDHQHRIDKFRVMIGGDRLHIHDIGD